MGRFKTKQEMVERIAHSPEQVAALLRKMTDDHCATGIPPASLAVQREVEKQQNDQQIHIQIGHSKEEQKVIVDFGRPVKWLVLTKEQCAGLINTLQGRLDQLD